MCIRDSFLRVFLALVGGGVGGASCPISTSKSKSLSNVTPKPSATYCSLEISDTISS